jgi:iron complex transport system substrate-binding protein
MRIVSLLPAATEIVAALGALDELVGVTHECDFPAEAAGRQRVTASAVDAHGEAAAVDAAVGELAAAGGAMFTLDERAIAALAPDVIVTQALCDVCAVSETSVRALAARLPAPPQIVTLGGSTLDGVFADVRRVGAAVAQPEAATALVASLVARLRRVHETLKAARAPRPRVAVIEWTEPLYAAGHWVPERVRRAGGIDVLASPGEHSRPRALAELVAADPEVVLVSPCGYSAARAADEAARLLGGAAWRWLAARRVWAMDANGIVSRPGPRLVDGVEAMAAIFNPALFAPVTADRALPVPPPLTAA